MNKRVLLIILDGFGEGKDYPGNAITRAKTPTLTSLRDRFPLTFLKASGHEVGLPEGVQGGSEVGHFTIGAGRQTFQTLEEINQNIDSGDFFKNPALVGAFDHVLKNPGSKLHLLGMISDQGIHSDVRHLLALLKMAKQKGIKECVIHAITDGRDVPMKSDSKYIEIIEKTIKELGMEDSYKIATMIGRYYAMDRDSNWDRTQMAYDLYTESIGTRETNPQTATENAYKAGVESDYYIKPVVLHENPIQTQDAVIFFNFRTDRARQLTWAFTGEKDDKISLKQPQNSRPRPYFVCMGEYSTTAPIAYPIPVINNNLGTVIENNGLLQFRIAETEKYAHVTYFLNSQVEKPLPHEDRLMIHSPKCPSYAEKPEMSAIEITKNLIDKLEEEKYSVVICNFANLDLVGHSGDLNATVKAVECIDKCLGNIVTAAFANEYSVCITGDHGNAEYMLYEDGSPCPSHTKNPVPFIFCDPQFENIANKNSVLRNDGALSSVAPTLLEILKITKPVEMTGESLFLH